MKKAPLFIAFAASTMLLASCGSHSEETTEATETTPTEEVVAEEVTYKVNTESSKVKWSGSMVGMHSHEGTLNITEGNLVVQGGNIVSGTITVDMTSMSTLDSNYNEDNTSEKLVGHLSSADFFAVEEHPTATFSIAGAADGNVNGQLTLKGKTADEHVQEVSVNETDGSVSATGTLTINRQNYDVTWTHPVKEMILSNDITLSIELNGSVN